MKVRLPHLIVCLLLPMTALLGQSPYQSSSDFAKYAMRLREDALLRVEPQVFVPTMGGTVVSGKYPWKRSIVTTVFWVGELPTQNNPVPNTSSSWDLRWAANFGGYDDPNSRRGYLPARFTPQLNPFYVALPYNDVTRGTTKPEARFVIPWFRDAFVKEGQSVCRDRWVAVRNRRGRVCYAQWSDCGPFRTDHYQYVFGNERPKWNLNKGAGLDISPAVRDYLGLQNTDVTDWQFVEFRDVPPRGPWAYHGENNHFVQQARRTGTRVATNMAVPGARAPAIREPAASPSAKTQDGPTVIMNSNAR
jgi:hypothetical protein